MPTTVSKLSTQSNESYQFISTEIFSSSSERHGFLDQHVLCSDVNKAIEYKAKARAFKAKALNTSQGGARPRPRPRAVYGILFVIQYFSGTKFLHF